MKTNFKIEEKKNLSNEDYHNSAEYAEFWSSSNLKKYLDSPKEAYFQKYEAENKTSTAMHEGTLIHEFLESKHKYGAEFDRADAPINEKTGKAYGSTTKKYLDKVAIHGELISQEEKDMLNSIWYSIQRGENQKFFDDILNNGQSESSFFVTLESGLKYKYRPDNLQDNVIVDYKKIKKSDFSEKGFGYAIRKYGYGISASFYQFFEFLRTGILKPFYIVWICTDAPYDTAIHDISNICYESCVGENGKLELIPNKYAQSFESLIKQHEKCKSTDNYPGLSSRYKKNSKGYRLIKTADDWIENYKLFEIEESVI